MEAKRLFPKHEKKVLIKPGLPVVMEYNDIYENSSLEDVTKAVSREDPVALYEIASRYRKGTGGVEQDFQKAIGYYKEVLRFQNHIGAFYHIGFLLTDGVCGEEKRDEGISYFEAAFDYGDSDSAMQLGICYEYGEIIQQSYAKAYEMYHYAADHDRKDAWIYIGNLYRKNQHIQKAIECYEEALKYDKCKEEAANELGLLYEFGDVGIDKDYDKAFYYHQLAYDNRDESPYSNSAFYLAVFLFYEKGNNKDDIKSFKLFQEDLNLGHDRSNMYLGYYYGLGIEGFMQPDDIKAFYHLENVLENQQAEAMYYQGVIELRTRKDVEKSKKCLKRAIYLGSEDAKKMLEDIENREKASQEAGPGPLLRRSSELLDSGKLHEALDTIKEAYDKFPNHMDVVFCYAILMDIHIYTGLKVGAEYDARLREECEFTLTLTEKLKKNSHEPKKTREIEQNMFYYIGMCHFYSNEYDDAIKMFYETNMDLYPYSAVAIAIIHMENSDRYINEFYKDFNRLRGLLNSKNWDNNIHQSAAYCFLSIFISSGAPKVPRDLNYAYYCIQQSYALDPEMAKDEITKYKKDIFGNIKYIP